jgi:hypothetical protein
MKEMKGKDKGTVSLFCAFSFWVDCFFAAEYLLYPSNVILASLRFPLNAPCSVWLVLDGLDFVTGYWIRCWISPAPINLDDPRTR